MGLVAVFDPQIIEIFHMDGLATKLAQSTALRGADYGALLKIYEMTSRLGDPQDCFP
jgi:hypothetical protein